MNLAKLRVLVIDDMASMRMMTKSVLRDLGIVSVQEANDGDKAIEMLANRQFDLIICDWDMPNVTGLETLRFVRANPGSANVPFIMLTANIGREAVVEAIQAGVSDYLAKPFKPADLTGKVLRVIGSARRPD